MPVRKSGAEAAKWMRKRYEENVTTLPGGESIYQSCQQACRMAWGLGPAGNAIDAYNQIVAAQKKSGKTYLHNDPRLAPIGAPHFWSGGDFGHVAIQAEYKEYVWTTDLPKENHIGVVHGAYIKQKWSNKRYLGWSTYYCGTDISSKFPKDSEGNIIPAPEKP